MQALGHRRGTQVYAQALCWEVEGYVPACRMSDVFGGSVLSNAWPTLPVGENAIGEELRWLGRNRVTCARAEQALIDGGSGTYAIDGHAVLSTSTENELAAYGAKYGKLGVERASVMGIHDVKKDRPVSAKYCDGALPDKSSAGEVFDRYRLEWCRILADMGFYSEEVLALLHQKGRTFVIPCPPNTAVRKAAVEDLSYTGEFTYTRNERGRETEVRVSYFEKTVSELEDAWQKHLDEEAKEKNGGKKRAKRVKRSSFPQDRVIVFRDESMHDRLVRGYRAQIGRDKGHTEEGLEELKPTFGVIALRIYDSDSPRDCYLGYKKRWRIETNYDHVSNGLDFDGLREQDCRS